ncbi:hypothetical protein BS643_17950 [Pseudomonas protegens]|uniref:hypothetical protein n=1 Tax=Pseudomonas protegens TaxID=380021 RepID=UPI0008070381|nr:hypothetical protein [Pseudomonas protegens]OBZ19676.1 hypothetical protein BBH57_22820 [Pseudomonas protegens]OBZ22475.1 hypothetical protein BBH58_17075 [Pseudomonas protegens]OKK41292.1 hypothetical protein BS643_17950 [Pseudomonas protegens]OKK43365.1 hypothetical protein BS644_22720 [Pseudomonas protegens]OKK55389.1 hypothetical protein BS646_29670 [Pseudomonas protegens]
MLGLAVAEQKRLDPVDSRWFDLSENERRLIRSLRQLTDRDRHQVQRLIEQLAKYPDDSVT